MQLPKGATIELTIHDLAFGGAGVGRYEKLAVFVPYALPGEKIRAQLIKIKKNYAEAKLVEVLEKSKQRIAPRCKHFGRCGGCSLQNLCYEDQLLWKRKFVEDALLRIGGIRGCVVAPPIGCDSPWFYRNKMEYSFGTASRQDQTHRLGLHPPARFRDVFDVEECFLSMPEASEILSVVRAWALKNHLAPFESRAGTGELRSLIIREGKNTGELLINLICAKSLSVNLYNSFAESIRKRFSRTSSLYATVIIQERGRPTTRRELLLLGKEILTEKLTVRDSVLIFKILPHAFFQPNTKQAEKLYATVLDFAHAKPGMRVLDLFCGTGTIGMFFAKLGCRVTGIDNSEQAIESAQQNSWLNSIRDIKFQCADITNLAAEAKGTDIIITDPPRAGIGEKTLAKILALNIPEWIYVSCNPTTLARDLKFICAQGYSIKAIQPVDMFPHTYHIECVVRCTSSKY